MRGAISSSILKGSSKSKIISAAVLLVVCALAFWPQLPCALPPSLEDIRLYQGFLQCIKRPADMSVDINTNVKYEVPLAAEDGSQLTLVNRTIDTAEIHDMEFTGPKGIYELHQHTDQWNALRKALYARNATSTTMPWFVAPIPLRFGPRSDFSRDSTGCDLHFSRPVYDATHSVALVYFYSEDENTQDSGTIYIMRRVNSSWLVVGTDPTLGRGLAVIDR